MNREQNQETQDKDKRAYLATDFYIDFLGSLVPGLFAIVIISTVLSWSWNILCHVLVITVAGLMESPPMSALVVQIVQWKDIELGQYGNIGLLFVSA